MVTMCHTFDVPRYTGERKTKDSKWCVTHGRWYNAECEKTNA